MTVSSTEDTQSRRLVAMLGDATERKTLEAQLVHQAFHDPLTELANRALFRSRVEHALSRRNDVSNTIAVLFLDLDHFKTVNDTLGHAAGDRLLRTVAERLLSATRGCDTVARLGGDEFAVLLEPVSAGGGPDIVADRIVSAMRRPIDTGMGRAITVGVSVGIATGSSGENPDVLLRNADVAMYESKGRARGSWLHFDPAMHTSLMDRVTLEADLHEAIERNQLSLVYQPIVDLASGRVISFEALLRWTHPRRGPVAPAIFVPVAEECDLILVLGRWVMREACRRAAAWKSPPGEPAVTIAVNLSAKQIQQPTLQTEVEQVLRESGLDPERLILEITETAIMKDTESTLTRLKELKKLGIRLAIDDFGTGYSSLSYPQQFPVDVLKIDHSFTDALVRGPNEAALVRTIIALADMLGLRTVAEGVEEPDQEAQLKLLGCTSAQGYLFGYPVGADAVSEMLGQGARSRRAAG
jgi:diguanylate cyclase (GGDEF)-like protein